MRDLAAVLRKNLNLTGGSLTGVESEDDFLSLIADTNMNWCFSSDSRELYMYIGIYYTVHTYCNCTLYKYTINVPTYCIVHYTMYIYTIHVHTYCNCTLYKYTINVHTYCNCTLYKYTINVPTYCTCNCTLYKYTINVHTYCNCTLYNYILYMYIHIVVVHCIQKCV